MAESSEAVSPTSSNYEQIPESKGKDKNFQSQVKVPLFNKPTQGAVYEDYIDFKNYDNLTIKDKLNYFAFNHLGSDAPDFIEKQLRNLPRKIFISMDLPDDLLKSTKEGTRPKFEYPRNKIRTTKYTPLNFIPKNLFFQFKNVANVYFLFLIILGAASSIFGVANPGLQAVPLIVILVITAFKDAFEDSRRAISDNELNNTKVHLVTGIENPNAVIDNVGPWRRFKKLSTRFATNLIFNHIVPFFNRKKRKQLMDQEKKGELHSAISNQESLVASATNASGITGHRLSVQTTSGFVNSSTKVSKPVPNTVTDASVEPSGTVKFRNRSWKDIYVGDIIRVRANEEIPADIVLLSTAMEDQTCYIETKNLDGETNLKSKHALKAGEGIKYGNDVERMKFWFECDSPNPNLYSFRGLLHVPNFQNPEKPDTLEPIVNDNVLLRGSTLRNTKWVVGVVMYTGRETKVMLNAGITPTKKSKISTELNLSVYINFLVLFILCFVSGIINGLFYNKKDTSRILYEFAPYSKTSAVSGVVSFFVALILYQALVPISLYISVEIIKTIQAYFIHSDGKMYYAKLDYPCVPKSWNISDDLGQVEYIFSDKTGTLTQNVMEFKKCSIGLESYGECYTEAKMGMQKRMGIDVIKEKIRMDKKIQDDRETMLKLLDDNVQQFSNGNEHSRIAKHVANSVTFISSGYVKAVLNPKDSQKYLNEWFMTALALCHTATTEPDPNDSNAVIVKAESPDENALVGVAGDLGIEFLAKSRGTVKILRYGKVFNHKVLNVIGFDSTRKRMSVVVEVPKFYLPEFHDAPEDEQVLVLLSKGADNVMFERLRSDSPKDLLNKTALYLEQFSKEGLRTLCITYKVLDSSYYLDWETRYHNANTSVDEDREEQIEKVGNEIEQDLTLIGSTAIEDRLQEGVPDSIAILGRAGIKLWVLTGDKIETAINIGFSCNLLGSDMKLLVVDNRDEPEDQQSNISSNSYLDMTENTDYNKIDAKITKFLSEEFGVKLDTPDEVEAAIADARNNHGTPDDTHAIIVDGASLMVIFDELNPLLQKKFLLLCKNCKAVLCCRVSPAQKAQVVRVVKDNLQVMTLAIGDGANDVAMIQAANIGVGIAGEEGRQAVMSSDYGLGQFRFLTRLVLVHGRWSYKRLAEMIPCFFYKNMVFTLTLFWYGIFTNFDGSYLFEFTLIMFYNFAFTSLPVIFMAVLDQDVSDTVSLLEPQLYRTGILGLEWSQYKFLYYMMDGMYQSALSFFFPYLLYHTGKFVDTNGLTLNHRFWMGTMVAMIVAISSNLYILLQQKRWDYLSLIIYAFSILIVFFWIGVWTSSVYSKEYYKAAAQVYGCLTFWVVFFLGILCNLLPRFIFDTTRRLYSPKDIDIVRERVQMGAYSEYKEGYDPTDMNDVEEQRLYSERNALDFKDFDRSSSVYNNGSSTEINGSNGSPKNLDEEANIQNQLPVHDEKHGVKNALKHPIGSIKRKLTITKPHKKDHHNLLSPLQLMRLNMSKNGEYTGSRTSLTTHEVPGLSQAESLISVHSRRSNLHLQ